MFLTFIDVQILIALKMMVIFIVSFYLKFQDKSKYFVKCGLNTLYYKLKRQPYAKMLKCGEFVYDYDL